MLSEETKIAKVSAQTFCYKDMETVNGSVVSNCWR